MQQRIPYDGNDLGAVYTKKYTAFRLWAPTADAVTLCLYREGDGDCLSDTLPMKRDVQGTWTIRVDGDLRHVYYTYRLERSGKTVESQDPYSVAVGVNGQRSMVLDLKETDPENFKEDHGPVFSNRTDLVICEISVLDSTADGSSGVKYPGKYLGLAEKGTKNKEGEATGLDYLKSLGITHVQIMPMYDFASIDEAAPKKREYNWGYDPLNYNVPEGSFSTDPFHGEVRIREMKEMIAAFHREGIGVIMDVVYNHTYDLDSCLQKCEPDYYYRMNGTRYSNASACGNEIASEQPMMRKYIVESVCYWAREYHVDGFRFDLMGVLDIDTMNEISRRLKEINPYIILYGEGWTGGTSTMPEFRRAMKRNARMLDGIGMFSDDIRDMVRGHVFYNKDCGYVSGKEKMKVAVRYCATGGVWHPQVDYAAYTYAAGGTWTDTPEKVINYVSCHDNLTLWDKLQISRPDCDAGERLAMNRLATAMVFTAQGVPFFLSGEEFARTKPAGKNGEVSENSYNLPYETNVLRYDWNDEQKELQQYYRGLIAFRKAHKGLRMTDAEEIRQNILFMEMTSEQTVAFTIRQPEETLLVAYNASGRKETLLLPDDRTWTLYIDDLHAGTEPIGSVHSNMELPATGRSNAPHIVSVSTEGVRAEVLLHALEDKEIYVSAGSACSSNKPSVSHTLKSIGLKPEFLDATIRFSFCVETTEEEIDYAVKEMAALVPMLQKYTRH